MQSFVPLKNSDRMYEFFKIMRNSEHMKPVIKEPLLVSANGGFLIMGFKILNLSLKVLIKTGSLMRVSTVCSS